MRVIVAKRCGTGEVVYVNANCIESFLAKRNEDNSFFTKIYFSQATKCEVDGDKTKEIAQFVSQEGDCGILDLVNDVNNGSYWGKKGENNNGEH